PDPGDIGPVLGVGDVAAARQHVGLLAVLAAALAVALAGEGAVAGPRPAELAGSQGHVDAREHVLDALEVLLQPPPVGRPAAPGPAPQVGDPLRLAAGAAPRLCPHAL